MPGLIESLGDELWLDERVELAPRSQARIGLDPYAYLRDVLERLPTHPANRIAELLPHRWHPANTH